MPESPALSGPVDLVDLIEQPAWKTILLNLVESEKMDPWDIDVCELADKYLQKINSLGGTDLRLPANAILASAILLKTKARFLRLSSLDEEEQQKEVEKFIEEFIPELQNPRRLKEGRVTLDSLVDVIERMVESSKKRKDPAYRGEELRFDIPFPDENIEEKIELIYEKVKALADSQGLVLFSKLLDQRNPNEMVNTFIPLLFLAGNDKISLLQEEFFGEIFISLNKKNGDIREV